MNGKQKRKNLLGSFSQYGLNECCCHTGILTNCCSENNLYFGSKTGKIGVLSPNDQEVTKIIDRNFQRINCGYDYLVVITNILGSNYYYSLYYKYKEVGNGIFVGINPVYNKFYFAARSNSTTNSYDIYYKGIKNDIASNYSSTLSDPIRIIGEYLVYYFDSFNFSIYYKNKFLVELRGSTLAINDSFLVCRSGTSVFKIYYNGELILQNNSYTNFYIAGDYLIGMYEISSTSYYDIYYKNSKIFERLQGYPNICYHNGDTFVVMFSNFALSIYYYKNEIRDFVSLSGVRGGRIAFYNDLSSISSTISDYPQGVLLYQGNILGMGTSATVLGNYGIINDRSQITLYYKDNIIYKGDDYYYLYDSTYNYEDYYPICFESDTLTLFYKGEIIATVTKPNSVVFCGIFFVLLYKSNTILYCNGNRVLELDFAVTQTFCCPNRIAFYNSATQIVTVYDEIFGKMEFDAETFIRLDNNVL
jgi:hypothetical protein